MCDCQGRIDNDTLKQMFSALELRERHEVIPSALNPSFALAVACLSS